MVSFILKINGNREETDYQIGKLKPIIYDSRDLGLVLLWSSAASTTQRPG